MNDTQQEHASSSILVIEDNASQLKTLTDILKTEGLRPIECPTGKEALEACYRHDAHVAILDLNLPDMDGIELLTEIKSHRLLKQIPVIIIGSTGSEEDIIQGLHIGALAYIKKPFQPANLFRVIKRVLRKSRLNDRTP